MLPHRAELGALSVDHRRQRGVAVFLRRVLLVVQRSEHERGAIHHSEGVSQRRDRVFPVGV